MSDDLVPYNQSDIVLPADVQREIFDSADQMAKDLSLALALLKKYQRNLSMAGMPDPEIVEARNLMRRYGESYEGWASAFRIFVDGRDITEHPDSIPGTALESIRFELEAGESVVVQVNEGEKS